MYPLPKSLIRLLVTIITAGASIACAPKRHIVNWEWTNAGSIDLEVYGEYWNTDANVRETIGAGYLHADVIGGKEYGNYTHVPETLEIRWRPWNPFKPGWNDDVPAQHVSLPVRSVVGEHFAGNLWIRFDGKQWTITPQTAAEFAEHRMYTLFPSAPWQPRLVVNPYHQYRLAEKDPTLNKLTTFNEADVKRAAELREADLKAYGLPAKKPVPIDMADVLRRSR